MRSVRLLLVSVIAACGSGEPGGEQEGADEGPERPPACEDVYDPAASVRVIVELEDTTGCLIDGEPTFFDLQRETCTDGRTLFWNERGYGFSDASWIDAETGDHPPAREVARCRAAAG